MRARLLLTFTLLLGLGCTESTGPLDTERPAFHVEERLGSVLLINDWNRPIYATVVDDREGQVAWADMCVVQECVRIPVGDSRAFDPRTILGGDRSGSVRVLVYGNYSYPDPDPTPAGPIVLRVYKVGSPFAR